MDRFLIVYLPRLISKTAEAAARRSWRAYEFLAAAGFEESRLR
jgi:hypothetical protein